MEDMTVPRVLATPDTLAAISRLVKERGPIMFFQSGGCCDGSLPLCFLLGEFKIGSRDVLLGHIGDCPFYIDGRQFEVWKQTQLIVGVSDGEPEGFSLGAGAHGRFSLTSRPFTPIEGATLTNQDSNDEPQHGSFDRHLEEVHIGSTTL